MNKLTRSIALLAISVFSLSAYQAAPPQPKRPGVSDDVRAALDRISADSLRGHLSFIASDALEGRNTPSRGLDIAAEYIAAQFRRAGLEPAGDDGYFQTAKWLTTDTNMDAFRLEIRDANDAIHIAPSQVSFSIETAL